MPLTNRPRKPGRTQQSIVTDVDELTEPESESLDDDAAPSRPWLIQCGRPVEATADVGEEQARTRLRILMARKRIEARNRERANSEATDRVRSSQRLPKSNVG